MVPTAALLGGSKPLLPAPRARFAGARGDTIDSRGWAGLARHRYHRHQHGHGPRHAQPRGTAHEPPSLPSQCRAAAHLRARMWWRRRAGSRGRHAWRKRARAPTSCFLRSTCARSAYVSTIRALPCSWPVRCLATARSASCCAVPGATGAAKAPRCAPALAGSANTSGQRPSTSWDGTSKTTALASY